MFFFIYIVLGIVLVASNKRHGKLAQRECVGDLGEEM